MVTKSVPVTRGVWGLMVSPRSWFASDRPDRAFTGVSEARTHSRRCVPWLLVVAVCAALAGCGGGGGTESSQPTQGLRLNPENPHYVDFRGKTTVLVTSSESYG